ncbi:hypothetical protein RyT2_17290 [Pseudolactococcus yaeyamensis]
MRDYKKVVTILVLSGIALVTLLVIGINQALHSSKREETKQMLKSIVHSKESKSQPQNSHQFPSESEFVSQFIASYVNYSSFDDYKNHLKPYVTVELGQAMKLDSEMPDFGSSTSSDMAIFHGDKHQYFAYATQSLTNGLNMPMAVMIMVEKTKDSYQVTQICEPALRGVAVNYIDKWSDKASIGIPVKTAEDKSALAFMRAYNNFGSLNNQKDNIRNLLTADMQARLAVNSLGTDAPLESEINKLSLWKSEANQFAALVQVNIAGEKTNQVYQFELKKVDDNYLVKDFKQATRQ